MVIDFHTHIFPNTLAPKAFAVLKKNSNNMYQSVTDMTLDSLLSFMDKSGVDKSVVLPVVTKQSQTVTINEWAAGINSERIVAFGGIYPHTDDFKRDIDLVVSLGLKGLKFHAEYQNFVLDEPKMLKIYDYALSRGLVIVHHAGFDPAVPPPFKTSPKQFAHLADEMKGGIVVAAHFGGQSQWDDVEKYLVGKNIYFDTSMGSQYYPREQFVRIAKNHGTDKILFGSDSPWSNAKTEIEFLNGLPLSDTAKQDILCGNALRILKI